jgi:regulation of enolase protein 1 (concanavalin A-like superfamily)
MSRTWLWLIPASVAFLLTQAVADEKKAQAIKGWGEVADPDKDCKVAEERGKLTFTIPGTLHDLNPENNLKAPRVLQDVEGDFQIQVKVEAFPKPEANTSSNDKYSFVSGGLLIWQDDKNYIRAERAAEGSERTPFVWVERFADGNAVSQKFHPVEDHDTQLRVERKGNKLVVSAKDGDGEWAEVLSEEVELPKKLKAGVHAINTTKKEVSTSLSELRLEAK